MVPSASEEHGEGRWVGERNCKWKKIQGEIKLGVLGPEEKANAGHAEALRRSKALECQLNTSRLSAV